MKVNGIQITDDQKVLSIKLIDILQEIKNGKAFFWDILYLYASGDFGPEQTYLEFEESVNESEKGLYIRWDELNALSHKFYQIIDITIIGCKDKNLLIKYEDEKKMYETCDIVIELIDGGFWEVFSKDNQLIKRLGSKFKEVKFLESDFQNGSS